MKYVHPRWENIFSWKNCLANDLLAFFYVVLGSNPAITVNAACLLHYKKVRLGIYAERTAPDLGNCVLGVTNSNYQ